MELRQLQYFMAVCKELHFTRAAEKLHISQPSLSQQIQRLEFIIGMPLFDRSGKTITLTEAGKVLLAHSQRIFFEVEQAKSIIGDLNGLQIGELTVGSLMTSTKYLLSPATLKFKRLYPNIKLSILGLRTREIRKGILENTLDLGITFLPIEDQELESIPLFTEELSLAVPFDHPLANVKEVEWKALEDVPTILLPKNYFLRTLIDTYCQKTEITLTPTLEMTTLESLVQMVAQNIGVTILPKPYLDFINSEQVVTVKIINPTPEREIGFVYRKDRFMCAATKTFIDQIKETSEEFSKGKQEA